MQRCLKRTGYYLGCFLGLEGCLNHFLDELHALEPQLYIWVQSYCFQDTDLVVTCMALTLAKIRICSKDATLRVSLNTC